MTAITRLRNAALLLAGAPYLLLGLAGLLLRWDFDTDLALSFEDVEPALRSGRWA